MTPAAVAALFRQYEQDAGIVGVALGPKEVGGKADSSTLSASFFVRKKLPTRGASRRLEDGRRRLPKTIVLNGADLPTDVVETAIAGAQPGPATDKAPEFRTGGKLSNYELTGTFGCLVRLRDSNTVCALTNRHIALDPGQKTFFPSAYTAGSVIGLTKKSADLVPDEDFLGVIDELGAYIDVDAAVVAIPENQLSRFSSDTPGIGTVDGIFHPDRNSFEAFSGSLIDRTVFASSWKSGMRRATISHVYYALRKLPDHTTSVAAFVVKSSDGQVPGQLGDSGKAWMTKVGDQTLLVGLHSGIVIDPTNNSRFAMATEMSSLSTYLGFDAI